MADPAADDLASGRTLAAIVLYPVVEKDSLDGWEGSPVDPAKVTIAFNIVTPLGTARADGRLITWMTIDSTNPQAVVINSYAFDARSDKEY